MLNFHEREMDTVKPPLNEWTIEYILHNDALGFLLETNWKGLYPEERLTSSFLIGKTFCKLVLVSYFKVFIY